MSALLAGTLLLSAPFQACWAVTVPGTAADSGEMPSLAMLSEFHGAGIVPRGADAREMAVSGALRKPGLPVSLDGKQHSGSPQTGSDVRLFLFVLLGFAAIAAWLAEMQGRKD